MCSPDGDVIDETEATGGVLPTVMTGRPNGDEGPAGNIAGPFRRLFHNRVNRLTYRTQGPLDGVQRSRTHY
jgi:hypothetical protein